MNIMKYKIHKNYKHRDVEIFLNTESKTDEYQDDVYKYAHNISIKNNYNKIIDVGCGSGYKLIKYFDKFNTVGFDLEKTVRFLRKNIPNKRWEISDFSKNINETTDIIICADVIEHLLYPELMLNWISEIDFKDLIISTPNRDLLVKYRGYSKNGPPNNPHHIREWSFNELNEYIGEYFNIINHFNVDDECCQVIHCKKWIK